jgi:hypothetical protein
MLEVRRGGGLPGRSDRWERRHGDGFAGVRVNGRMPNMPMEGRGGTRSGGFVVSCGCVCLVWAKPVFAGPATRCRGVGIQNSTVSQASHCHVGNSMGRLRGVVPPRRLCREGTHVFCVCVLKRADPGAPAGHFEEISYTMR